MIYEYKQNYCYSWDLADELTRLSAEGWELFALVGEPHMIQQTYNCAVADQQVYLVRRELK